ncbi:MAG: GNAT family N-acetyltransferase [Actinomycetota bacterium]
MDIVIRDAQVGDAEHVAEAHIEGWREGYRGLIPGSFLDSAAFADARRETWRQRLSGAEPNALGEHSRVLVAVASELPVGFGVVGPSRDARDGGELYAFYLHPAHWGSGAADLLIDACHAALGAAHHEAMLWVLRDNARARRFYERNGWSCGTGPSFVEAEWAGPTVDGVAVLDEPLIEVQYRRRLEATS